MNHVQHIKIFTLCSLLMNLFHLACVIVYIVFFAESGLLTYSDLQFTAENNKSNCQTSPNSITL